LIDELKLEKFAKINICIFGLGLEDPEKKKTNKNLKSTWSKLEDICSINSGSIFVPNSDPTEQKRAF
jgi:hypothetical protein